LTLKNKREETIKNMLLNGRLGNAQITANKLQCSKRTVERIIQKLRNQGLSIIYNNKKKRYQNIHDGQNDKGNAENLK
jgi:biotin operon repressor